MHVSPVTTGVVRLKSGRRGLRRYLVDDWREETLPVQAFLVHRDDGHVLFDTGQTVRATQPGWFPRWHPFFRLSRFELAPDDEAGRQLQRMGIEPEGVRHVVLSHLHTDHAGGLEPFAAAQVIVSRREWELSAGLKGKLRGYLPQHWPTGLVPTLVDFVGPPLGPFPASYDIAGDGTLVLVPTPGHTDGHMALLVRSEERSWLLAGDMAHAASEVMQLYPAIATWCRNKGVAILTAHDPARSPG